MIPTSLENTLTAAVRIAREAGKVILPFFHQEGAHRVKADHSPLTEADLASHAFLVEALGRLTPSLMVVSEESADREIPASLVDACWLIDPLDGTKEFIKGNPQFTVNVALMNGPNPLLGVVHVPASELTYYAQRGRGAWRQEHEAPAVPIRTRSANPNRLTVVASADHSGPLVKRLLQRLSSPEVTSIGSSLKFCLIAEGSADLYLRDGPTMEWDTAAAQCVLEAAGGLVLEPGGAPLCYGKAGLKNSSFVALGDPALKWNGPTPASEVTRVLRDLFHSSQDRLQQK